MALSVLQVKPGKVVYGGVPRYCLEAYWNSNEREIAGGTATFHRDWQSVLTEIARELVRYPSLAIGKHNGFHWRIREVVFCKLDGAGGINYTLGTREVLYEFPSNIADWLSPSALGESVFGLDSHSKQVQEWLNSVSSTPSQNDSSNSSDSASTPEENPTSSPGLSSEDDGESSLPL